MWTQLNGENRLEFGRAKDAVKEFDLPLDVAIEYSEAKKVLSQIHTNRPITGFRVARA